MSGTAWAVVYNDTICSEVDSQSRRLHAIGIVREGTMHAPELALTTTRQRPLLHILRRRDVLTFRSFWLEHFNIKHCTVQQWKSTQRRKNACSGSTYFPGRRPNTLLWLYLMRLNLYKLQQPEGILFRARWFRCHRLISIVGASATHGVLHVDTVALSLVCFPLALREQ